MSKRADPNSGTEMNRDAPKRARPMTVYDRMEDARRRRQELLAKGNGPAPRHAQNLKTPTTPPAPVAMATTQLVTEPQATLQTILPPEPKPKAQPGIPPKRVAGGYWTGLFQAMTAIAVIAVLVATFGSRGTPQEEAANAAVPVTPATSETMTEAAPRVTEVALIADRVAQSTDPATPQAPDSATLGLTIAPLSNQPLETRLASLAIPAADSLPTIPNPVAAPPTVSNTTAPLVLTSTPPARQRPAPIETPEPPAVNAGLAEATNVVLLVPAFVPQTTAENAVATAADIGIPVDQTRRANVSISRTNIRYFHAQDAEAATILASGLGGVARDFTDFTPPPNPGVIEIWIQGRGGSTNTQQGSATARGIEADLEALRNTIARALNAATGN
ncbi:MAG: hypothetical protein KJO30_00925 [Boseongicola sp.]|nr:hypothetical protein [Boseongicola sp.]